LEGVAQHSKGCLYIVTCLFIQSLIHLYQFEHHPVRASLSVQASRPRSASSLPRPSTTPCSRSVVVLIFPPYLETKGGGSRPGPAKLSAVKRFSSRCCPDGSLRSCNTARLATVSRCAGVQTVATWNLQYQRGCARARTSRTLQQKGLPLWLSRIALI